jgi:hypothetical protein
MLTTLWTVALLAGSTVGVTAQDEGVASEAGALTTGQVIPVGGSDFTEFSETDGSVIERGRTATARSEMSDARLSGEVVIKDNADRWYDGPRTPETFLADLLWGTIEITNEGGTWTGTAVGTTDPMADGGGVTYYELVGSGGYEALSAIIFQREIRDPETDDGEHFWNGVIFPGELPPDR